ncbi:Regulatory protein wetA [Cytospora mali]|uniref:Regulatory protein wetA n=1 Tax=Cytospora mali TaxID=578113 RepID=A0A194VBJ1_CYTMA|nr:Regulatory protein wetA [Valsa mali var. pyri (nom. inval.)]
MAFARAMDYTIDKDEFWNLSCPTGQAGAGASSTAEEQQRFPSDFFDQFVVMEEGSGADFTRKPSGDSFFVPLQDNQQGPGGDGMSQLTSSVTEDITNTLSNTDSAALSYTTSNLSSVDNRPTQLASLTAAAHKKQQQPQPAPQGQAAGRDGNSDTSHHVVLGQLNPETLEQRRRLLTGRRGQNPQPASGGSISDSELLQLEGLSVNSPRKMASHHGPASSTPPTMQSFGPSTTTTTGNISGLTDEIDLSSIAKNQQNHKSGSRRFETIYSTIRRAVGGHSRGRVQQQHPNTAPIPQTVIPSHMESAKKATRRLASESQTMPTSWNGLPISPALTEMANGRPSDASTFVNGYLDDPFFDPSVSFHNTGGLAPAAQINGGKKVIYNGAIPHTPSRTPIIKAETTNGDDISQFFPTTSESWGLDATFATTTDLSNHNNILSFDGTGMDTWGFDPSSDGGNHGMAHLGTSLPETSSSRNHHNLTIQVPPTYARDHRHSAPGANDMATNGLMIQMPQPQTPSTAPLLSSQIMPGMHDGSAYPFPDEHPQSMHTFRSGGGGGPYTTGDHGRRHKPPAPSSGASDISSITAPTTDTQSHAIRKRRSASSWLGGRRTTSNVSSSSSSAAAAAAAVGDIMMSSSSAGSGEGGGGQIGFVNYTPNDHNVLMTGVAPSGSSKTKARREKEAMERQRKLSEAGSERMA